MMVKEGYKEVQLLGEAHYIPEDWDIKSLNKYIDVLSGYSFNSSNFNDDKKGVPLIRIRDLQESEISTYYNGDFDEKYFIEENDILIGMDGNFYVVKWNNEKALLNQRVCRVESVSKELNQDYLYYRIKPEINKIHRITPATTVKHLSIKDVKKIRMPFPPLKEQKKIAAILSSVDKTIEKTDQVIEKTKELKKGLMQQLLTKGIGHDEFKEVLIGVKKFNIPVNWKLKSINFFANDFISGGTPSTDESEYWNGDIDFITGAYIKNRVITQGKDKISKEGLNNSSSNLIPKNNVIICTRTAVGNIGKNLIDIAISQDVTGIILNKEIIDVDYFVWSVIRFKYLLKIYQQGSTIKGITRNVLKSFKLPLPPLEEQKKIAKILSTVEEKVQKEEEYKAKLERLKKGLMQKLLTGEIRVNVDDIKEA